LDPILSRKLLELEKFKKKIKCGKVLTSDTKIFPLGGVQGHWATNVNFGPPDISELLELEI